MVSSDLSATETKSVFRAAWTWLTRQKTSARRKPWVFSCCGALCSNSKLPQVKEHTRKPVSMEEIANEAPDIGTNSLFAFYRDNVETSKQVIPGQMVSPFVSTRHYMVVNDAINTDPVHIDSQVVEETVAYQPSSIVENTPEKRRLDDRSNLSASTLRFQLSMLTPEVKKTLNVLSTPPDYPQSVFLRERTRRKPR